MISKRFNDKKSFLRYHNESIKEIFIDTSSDTYIQQKKIALLLLEEIKKKYHLKELKNVIEESEIRKTYKKELKALLQTSIRKTEELYLEVKREFLEK